MEKEKLLKKWLADELSKEEAAAFLKQEEGGLANNIVAEAKRFKANQNATDADFDMLKTQLQGNSKKQFNKFNLMKIAAVLIVLIGLTYFILPSGEMAKTTLAGEIDLFQLPDTSQVQLNAASSLTYNEDTWQEERNVSLNGEAYFKVAKGKKFSVQTNNGIISVVGTQYNVKSRSSLFVVSCYEGSVKVESNNQEILLQANEEVRLINGVLESSEIAVSEPSWVNGYAKFKNQDFAQVIKELERQYGIEITYTDSIENRKFTGRFDFNNLELALQQITTPLQLSYTIKSTNDVVINE